MSEDDANVRRRRFLVVSANVIGWTGLAFAAVPFVASLRPSARARAQGGPLEVDVAKLEPEQLLTIEWRGKPIFIVRRTPAMLARLERNAPLLADPLSHVETQQPAYAKNLYRSIRPEYLVLIGLCTHLGCVPTRHFETGAVPGLVGADWPGGWFCHCHGSKFDIAGRVFKSVPAPTNLVVPPYRYDGPTRIVIGEHPQGPQA